MIDYASIEAWQDTWLGYLRAVRNVNVIKFYYSLDIYYTICVKNSNKKETV